MEDKKGIGDTWEEVAKDLAESHVSWFLDTLRPLLIDHMVHGFKHGMEFSRANDCMTALRHSGPCPLGRSKNGE